MRTGALVPPSLTRKIRREKRHRNPEGFPQIGSLHYLEWLSAYHQAQTPKLYFEVGTESGASLSLARCASIAVDPRFRIEQGVLGMHPELHLFEKTSDDFFASHFLERYDQQIDFAFLDGMHLIEFLLRDFINIEKHMASDGAIAMHDCLPMSFPAAEREWDKTKTRPWVGDVWKMLPILRRYRPDLHLSMLDLAPSGLLVIDNLDAQNTTLTDQYDEILAEFIPLSLEDYGLNAFEEVAQLKSATLPTPARARVQQGRWEVPLEPNTNMLRIAIKTPKAREKRPGKIVDYAFARGVADAFLSQGHAVRIDGGPDWYVDTEGTDFDILLRGRGGFVPQPDVPLVTWVIYPGKAERHLVTEDEIARSAHTFFASDIALETFGQLKDRNRCSVMMQGFDHKIMYPPTNKDAHREGTAFVGSNHFGNGMRPIISMASEAGISPAIWGRGWEGTDAMPFVQGGYLENEKVGNLYRGSAVVLCDHMNLMREGGYVSNRIFDALACGAAVISDDIKGLPQEIAQYVTVVKNADEMKQAVHDIAEEGHLRRQERYEMALWMMDHHSLAERSKQILNVLKHFKDSN